MKRIFTLLLTLGIGSACAMARDIKVLVVTPPLRCTATIAK